MPVRDGSFVERTPLTAAERHVDFVAHNRHIIERRRELEQRCTATARRIGIVTVDFGGVAPPAPVTKLASQLESGLAQTAQFGYKEARRELAALRADRPVQTAWVVPRAGRQGELAREGLDGIRRLLRTRARDSAQDVAIAAARSIAASRETDKTLLAAAAAVAATRSLHNHVLELIGETLNLGRTAGVLSLDNPPEYAMRSEQLDENTCPACDDIHGTVVEVDSPEFYAILPPAECYGGGRCRGVMVFADGAREVRQAYVQENPSRPRD